MKNMKNWLIKKNVIFVLLGIGVVGIGVDYYNVLDYTIADPISNFASSLLVISVFLCFVTDQVFFSWLTFAKWWIPLTILLIVISPTNGSSAFFPAFFSKELTSMWMGGLFVLISLLLIIIKSLSLRGK